MTDATPRTSAPMDARSRRFAWGMALLPVLVHAVLLLSGRAEFERADWNGLIWFPGVYLLLAWYCLRQRARALRFLAGLYALLLALAIFEIGYALLVPRVSADLPWRPMKRVSTANASAMPGVSGQIEWTVGPLGVRGPPIGLAEFRAQDVRVLCVGGSTTECLYVSDCATWPWRLQDRLAEATGKRVFVGNAGKSGHITLNHERLLETYALAPAYEYVVLLCGINDAGALALRQDYAEREAKLEEETFQLSARRPYYRKLGCVAVASHLLARWFTSLAVETQDDAGRWYDVMRARRKDALAKKVIAEMPENLAERLATYKRNVARIVRLCRARNQKILLLTQPTIYRADLDAETAKLLWQYTPEGAHTPEVLANVLAAFNAALREVAREEQADCIDLDAALAKDTTVFYDDCHFNLAGSAQVADLLLPYFEKQLKQK